MRKLKTHKWIIALFILISISIKSQTCTSPLTVAVNGNFIGLDSTLNTRYYKFNASSSSIRMKFWIKNFSGGNYQVRLFPNDCANIPNNLITTNQTSSGDSLTIIQTSLTSGNDYLIEISKINPSSNYIVYDFWVNKYGNNNLQAFGCSTVCTAPSSTCQLVCNGSFECIVGTNSIVAPGMLNFASNWASATDGGTPDLFGPSSVSTNTSLQVPCNYWGYENAQNANQYAGFYWYAPGPSPGVPYTEYLETKLTSPMVATKKYVVSFYVSKADFSAINITQLGVYLTNAAINYTTPAYSATISEVPKTIFTNTTSLNNITGWVRLSFCYTASGGEEYLAIGRPQNAVNGTTITPTTSAVCTPSNDISTTLNSTNAYMYVDNVSVQLLEVDAGPNITICPSVVTALTPSFACNASPPNTNLSYSWTPSTALSSNTVFAPTTAATNTLTYTLSITATSEGTMSCSFSDFVTVNVYPTTTLTIAPSQTLVCPNYSVTLTGSGGTSGTYTWQPGGYTVNPVVMNPSITTTYTLTAKNAYNCLITNTITISTYTVPPFFTVTATPTIICTLTTSPTTSTVSATGASSYTWMPGNVVSNSVIASSPQIYTVSATSTIGCITSNTIDISGTEDYVFFNPIPSVCGTQTIDLATYVNPPSALGTFSVNGTQISGSLYTFTPSASAYTVGFTYTAGILCNNIGTYALTTNTDCCNSSTLTPITTTLITGTSTITGGKVINQNITIASTADITFDGGEFLIAPNVQITVQTGATLRIEGAHLYACQSRMWDGINVQFNGRVIAIPSSTGMSTFIEDAKNAINVEPITSPPPTFAAPIEVHNTIFNKNYTAININTVNISTDLDVLIQENVFTCRTITFTPISWPTTSTVSPQLRSTSSSTATSGLAAPYPLQSFSYTTCLSPYSGLPSNAGIRLTNVSYSIGSTYGVEIGESGASTDQTDFNLFDALAYGIYAEESNVSVINNVFQNTRQYTTPPPRPRTKGGSAIYYYVSNDYFRKLNLTNTISTYSASPTVGNRFWDCHMAVEATRVYNFNMQYNTIRSTQATTGGTGFLPGNTGIYLSTNRFGFYIKNNEFTNLRYPINIPITSDTYNTGSGTQTGIYANNLGILFNNFGPQTSTATAAGNNYVGDAVTITSPMSVTWNKQLYTGISVVNNSIDRTYRGITISGIDSYSTTVKENTISIVNDVLFSATQRGIYLTNTTNNIVVITNTLSANNNTNTAITLVYAGTNYGTANSPSITCNYLSSGYQGFEFNSTNSVTVWKGNQMQGQARGMSLISNGRIGTQGGTGAPSGNAWNGSWTGNNGTYVDAASDATLSILYVSAYPPNPGGPFPLLSYANTANTPATTGSFSCGGGGGGGGRYAAGQGSVINTGNMNNSSSAYRTNETESYASEELKYIATLTRYKYLDKNDSIRNSSSGNINFYNGLANTSVANFVQAENYIYKNQLSAAVSAVAAITPTNIVEVNYVKYFELYNNYKQDNLSENDLTELQNLANLCPGTNGAVIYNARALYNVITKSVMVYTENCDNETTQRIGKSTSNTSINPYNWDVNLYPNPSTGVLNIIGNNINDNVNITIKDVNGKSVLNGGLILKEFIGKLELNLANGIYFISVSNQNNETITKKLVITK